MKSKIIFLLIAWAFFYGMAVAGGAAQRKSSRSTADIANNCNNAISGLNVENR